MIAQRLIFLFSLLLLLSCNDEMPNDDGMTQEVHEEEQEPTPKIDGVSFVSPPNSFPGTYLEAITAINADWICVIPFGFSQQNSPTVTFDSQWQWWGESTEGVKTICDYAIERNLNIMIKPHVWLQSDWIGYYDLDSEEDWLLWEESYTAYIMHFAHIAEEKGAAMFCIGTEYKVPSVERPEFWRDLANEVREIFSGEITYAANWDNYQNIEFWSELDYIGIDSYFPLVESKTPSVSELNEAWVDLKSTLSGYCNSQGKNILFTEYGWMSSDYTAWQNWENEGNLNSLELNMEGQKNAYDAFFQSLWDESWFSGGFLWKWYPNHATAGGLEHKMYTPQNKPAADVISENFARQ